jgi:hypothetical protein
MQSLCGPTRTITVWHRLTVNHRVAPTDRKHHVAPPCRQDAVTASTNLHTQVEKLKGELSAEATNISNLRQNVSAAAQQEAQTLAQLQGQVRP